MNDLSFDVVLNRNGDDVEVIITTTLQGDKLTTLRMATQMEHIHRCAGFVSINIGSLLISLEKAPDCVFVDCSKALELDEYGLFRKLRFLLSRGRDVTYTITQVTPGKFIAM